MPHIKFITSGKGGAGKSTVGVFTAAALAQDGWRVLLLELDAGLRGLDMMLGVSDKTVFDVQDVLESRCSIEKAIVECSYASHLHLLPASIRREYFPQAPQFARLCRGLSEKYDYLVIDTPAGLGLGFEVSLSVADSALIVVTPDPVSVRDAASVARLLFEHGMQDAKLVVNRLPPKPKQMLVPDLDEVIDAVGVQLIGVVPEDPAVAFAAATGTKLVFESPASLEFVSIAHRIEGKYIPLSIH